MRLDFCVACNSKDRLHQHHLVPKVLGGPDSQDNLITLCHSCHNKMHRLQERGLLNAQTLAEVGSWLALAEGRAIESGGTNTYSERQAEAADEFAESCRAHVEEFLRQCSPQNRPTFAKLARFLTHKNVKTFAGGTTWASGQVYSLIDRLKIDWMAMKNANRLEALESGRKQNERQQAAAIERDIAAMNAVAPHIKAYEDITGSKPPAVWIAAKLNEIGNIDNLGQAWTANRVRTAQNRIAAVTSITRT